MSFKLMILLKTYHKVSHYNNFIVHIFNFLSVANDFKYAICVLYRDYILDIVRRKN